MSSTESRTRAPILHWRLGVEVELLAPRGRSREDLAAAIAQHHGARVRRFFHPQGEPSKAPGTPFFENLTLGFLIEDDAGNVLAKCVDDLTLQDDLDQKHAPQPGWYRIVSDDSRFLRLTMRHADASEPLRTVLRPIADIFGSFVHEGENGMVRVADEDNTPIVLGAPLPGERERPCELITSPIEHDHAAHLETLLGLASSLGFTVPAEGATHLHFDAGPLADTAAFANLVRFLSRHSDSLKEQFKPNPRCRRLGSWPPELLALVEHPEFTALTWEEALGPLKEIKLTKYCDFNVRNMIHPVAGKNTFEVRILPVSLDHRDIMEAASTFAAVLDWACGGNGEWRPVPDDLDAFIGPPS